MTLPEKLRNELLYVRSYHAATWLDATTLLLGMLADLLEFSRNYLVNTSYPSARKNSLSKNKH